MGGSPYFERRGRALRERVSMWTNSAKCNFFIWMVGLLNTINTYFYLTVLGLSRIQPLPKLFKIHSLNMTFFLRKQLYRYSFSKVTI